MTPPPLLSVITPCLNRAATIEAAIASVQAQRDPQVEHIVVDGGSTDGTAEILARHPHLHVLRGPDRNLYDAINKGLRLARGDVVGFLNSDDLYAPGAFAAARRALADPALDMAIGAAEFFADDGQGGQRVLRRLSGMRAVGLTERNVIGDVTVMNAAFFRKRLLDRVGGFDDRFPLAADKDFWMRLAILAPPHRVLPDVVYRYRSHAGSLTFAAHDMREKLSSHLLATARTRFAEASPGTLDHAAYRRWHAWAVGYRTLVQARRGHVAGLLGTAMDGFRADILWPARFLRRLPEHWRQRGARRGSPPGDDTGRPDR